MRFLRKPKITGTQGNKKPDFEDKKGLFKKWLDQN